MLRTAKREPDWEDAAKHAKVNGKKTPLTRKKDHEIYRQALKRFSLPQCRQIIALLSEYDIKVRENPKELEQTLLEMMLSTIILHKGLQTAGHLLFLRLLQMQCSEQLVCNLHRNLCLPCDIFSRGGEDILQSSEGAHQAF